MSETRKKDGEGVQSLSKEPEIAVHSESDKPSLKYPPPPPFNTLNTMNQSILMHTAASSGSQLRSTTSETPPDLINNPNSQNTTKTTKYLSTVNVGTATQNMSSSGISERNINSYHGTSSLDSNERNSNRYNTMHTPISPPSHPVYNTMSNSRVKDKEITHVSSPHISTDRFADSPTNAPSPQTIRQRQTHHPNPRSFHPYSNASHQQTKYPQHQYQQMNTSQRQQNVKQTQSPSIPECYKHNRITAFILLPPLLLSFAMHSTPLPSLTLVYSLLLIYAADLAGNQEFTMTMLWLAFALLSILTSVCSFNEIAVQGLGWFGTILYITIQIMNLMCLTCWATIQFQWLHSDLPEFAIAMERLLHKTLPISSSFLITQKFLEYVLYQHNHHVLHISVDIAYLAAPYIFLLWFVISLAFSAGEISSYTTPTSNITNATNKNQGHLNASYIHDSDKKEQTQKQAHTISAKDGVTLSLSSLILPLFFHIIAFRHHVFNFSQITKSDICDLTLVITIPYLIHSFMERRGTLWWKRHLPSFLRSSTSDFTIFVSIGPLLASIVATFAFEFRYLVPAATSFALLIHNDMNDVRTPFAVCFYLTIALIFLLAAIWMWERKDARGNLILGEEYHEDITHIMIIFSSISASCAFSIPWVASPVLAMSALSMVLFASTGLLRFITFFILGIISISIFALHFRFAYIDRTINIIPGFISLSLLRFSYLVFGLGILLIIIFGMVYRSTGGTFASTMRRLDVAGLCFLLYSILCFMVEAALMGRQLHDVSRDIHEIQSESLYPLSWSLASGLLLVLLGLRLESQNAIKFVPSKLSICMNCGKILSSVTQISLMGVSDPEYDFNQVFFQTGSLAAFFLVLVHIPYLIPQRKFIKGASGGFRSSLKKYDEKRVFDVLNLNLINDITIGIYCVILLPFGILFSFRSVVNPIINILIGDDTSTLYMRKSCSTSQMIGYSCCIWGLSVLTALKHLLPEGGAEVWRKSGALSLLVGLTISLIIPTIPSFENAESDLTTGHFISSMSNMRSSLDRGSIGSWGLIVAGLAVILALAGPLNFGNSAVQMIEEGKGLMRLMVFSVMVGCGLSWFVTILLMEKEQSFLPLFMTLIGTMAMSFLGTIACVISYFVKGKDFDEAQMVQSLWLYAFFPFMMIPGCLCLSLSDVSVFGSGGWLSTYLTVCSCITFAHTLALRSRNEKTVATRAAANASCLLTWTYIIIVIYGQCGISGVGVSLSHGRILGMPASLVYSCLASSLFYLLESEPLVKKPTRRKTLEANDKKSNNIPVLGIRLSPITTRDAIAVPICATSTLFLLVSAYVIFFRGCFVKVYSYDDIFTTFEQNAKLKQDVASVVQRSLIHNDAVVALAKLAGCGIWTSKKLIGPIMHALSLLCILPTWFIYTVFVTTGARVPSNQFLITLPLNVLPLVITRGMPTLKAAAFIGLVFGIYHYVILRRIEWSNKMKL